VRCRSRRPTVGRGSGVEPNHRGRRDGVGQVLLRALLAVVAVVGTLVCSASLAPAAHATTPYSPLTWGAPTPVDHQAPYDNGLGITATSCPSASLCVAVDDFGNVLASTDPAGGAGTWHKWAVEPRGAFVGLSCPSVSLCVAVDDEGGVVTSTDPAGGIATWHTTKLPNGGGAFTVACPTATFCVANVGAGVETSTDPAGGAGAWDSTGALVGANGLSCPSVSFCVGSKGRPGFSTRVVPWPGGGRSG